VTHIIIFRANTERTLFYAVRMHVVQHLSFALGVYMADKLLLVPRRYFDHAILLEYELLEQRVEQLKQEKERANYDREMLRQVVTKYERSEGSEKPSESVSSSAYPSRPESISGEPQHAAIPEDEVVRDPQAAPSVLGLDAGHPLPDSGLPTRRTAKSSSGWTELETELSGILRQTIRRQTGAGHHVAAGEQSLNPNAAAWPATATTASHRMQEITAASCSTAGLMHAQPEQLMEASGQPPPQGLSSTTVVQFQPSKSATVIRREKRVRQKERAKEAMLDAQYAAHHGQHTPVPPYPPPPPPPYPPPYPPPPYPHEPLYAHPESFHPPYPQPPYPHEPL